MVGEKKVSPRISHNDVSFTVQQDIINDGIHAPENATIVTPALIKHCISKWSCGKDGGAYGFSSDYIIKEKM